jgi:hypothetical protein
VTIRIHWDTRTKGGKESLSEMEAIHRTLVISLQGRDVQWAYSRNPVAGGADTVSRITNISFRNSLADDLVELSGLEEDYSGAPPGSRRNRFRARKLGPFLWHRSEQVPV